LRLKLPRLSLVLEGRPNEYQPWGPGVNSTAQSKSFHIATFGCQMNLADSATLVDVMQRRGHRRVMDPAEADLLILNTCSVREKAEQRVIGRLWTLIKYKQAREGVRIAVVGCMAQRLGRALIEQVPHVDFVLGPDRLFELPDLLVEPPESERVRTTFGYDDIDTVEPVRQTDFSAFVTVSRGCDNYCTYCIVPYVRGRERAHSPRQVVASIRRLVDEGVVEIMLLGQNVNSYRHGEVDFPRLLMRILDETEVPRIRFMTSHPKDLSDGLIDVMAGNDRMMPHVHLPLQAGSDRILKMMGRGYSLSHYLGIVEKLRTRLEYISLTTDLIVGFPSETEAEYRRTLDAVREIEYDAAFTFRYSVRDGTEAAGYDDDVPEEEKIRRLTELIDLQQAISQERNQREVGRVWPCLIEGSSRRSEQQLRARTPGNKIVLFPAAAAPPGTVVPVRITVADAFTLHGEIVEKKPCLKQCLP
jgi:tRNA-2-methylthio-N6-dimethylallyladenosine synthase